MRLSKIILSLFPIVFLAACGGNGEYEYNHSDISFIDWAGSANGTLVVDATDDSFEFEINTGYLHFGSTTYTNAWVDAYGDFYIDSELIGSVNYILSVDHDVITALISNNGYYIDFYGLESDLSWSETLATPIYALQKLLTEPKSLNAGAMYRLTAQQGKVNSTTSITPPLNKRNVYYEKLLENTISTIN